MCFSVDDFKVGTNDILLGSIHGCAFYMSKDQFEYWQHTHLTVDVIACRGSSFSLEIPLGLHFVVLSRLYSEAESADLDPVQTATSQSSS